MPLNHQVRWKPEHQKIPGIIPAEQPEKSSPRVALPQDLQGAGAGLTAHRRGLRSPDSPREQPYEASESQHDKQRPPAEVAYHKAANQHAERRPDFAARIDEGVSRAAAPLGKT